MKKILSGQSVPKSRAIQRFIQPIPPKPEPITTDTFALSSIGDFLEQYRSSALLGSEVGYESARRMIATQVHRAEKKDPITLGHCIQNLAALCKCHDQNIVMEAVDWYVRLIMENVWESTEDLGAPPIRLSALMASAKDLMSHFQKDKLDSDGFSPVKMRLFEAAIYTLSVIPSCLVSSRGVDTVFSEETQTALWDDFERLAEYTKDLSDVMDTSNSFKKSVHNDTQKQLVIWGVQSIIPLRKENFPKIISRVALIVGAARAAYEFDFGGAINGVADAVHRMRISHDWFISDYVPNVYRYWGVLQNPAMLDLFLKESLDGFKTKELAWCKARLSAIGEMIRFRDPDINRHLILGLFRAQKRPGLMGLLTYKARSSANSLLRFWGVELLKLGARYFPDDVKAEILKEIPNARALEALSKARNKQDKMAYMNTLLDELTALLEAPGVYNDLLLAEPYLQNQDPTQTPEIATLLFERYLYEQEIVRLQDERDAALEAHEKDRIQLAIKDAELKKADREAAAEKAKREVLEASLFFQGQSGKERIEFKEHQFSERVRDVLASTRSSTSDLELPEVRGMITGRWHLSEEWVSQLFETDGTVKRSYEHGVRNVVKVGPEEGVTFHFKAWPEMPGMELAVTLLHQILFQTGAPMSDIVVIAYQGRKIPFLLTETVEGHLLRDYLLWSESAYPDSEDRLHKESEKVSHLNRESFWQQFIMMIFTHLQDQKTDNLIVDSAKRLVSIDHDRCFVKDDMTTGSKLLVQSALMVFPLVSESIDYRVKNAIRKWPEANDIVMNWLDHLQKLERRLLGKWSAGYGVSGGFMGGIVDGNDRDLFFKEKSVVLGFHIQPGAIFELIRNITTVINLAATDCTGLDLLRATLPKSARLASDLVADPTKSIRQRFRAITDYELKEDQEISVSSTATILLNHIKLDVGALPSGLTAHWMKTMQPPSRLIRLVSRIEQLSVTAASRALKEETISKDGGFEAITYLNDLYPFGVVQRLLRPVDFSKIKNPELEKALLNYLKKNALREIQIKGSGQLTNSILASILSRSRSLNRLEITNCKEVDDLDLSRLRDASEISLESMLVKKIDARYCTNLKTLKVVNCHRLNTLELPEGLVALDVTGSTKSLAFPIQCGQCRGLSRFVDKVVDKGLFESVRESLLSGDVEQLYRLPSTRHIENMLSGFDWGVFRPDFLEKENPRLLAPLFRLQMEKIIIRNNPSLTHTQLYEIVKNSKWARHVDITGATRITNEATGFASSWMLVNVFKGSKNKLEYILSLLPRLETVETTGSGVTDLVTPSSVRVIHTAPVATPEPSLVPIMESHRYDSLDGRYQLECEKRLDGGKLVSIRNRLTDALTHSSVSIDPTPLSRLGDYFSARAVGASLDGKYFAFLGLFQDSLACTLYVYRRNSLGGSDLLWHSRCHITMRAATVVFEDGFRGDPTHVYLIDESSRTVLSVSNLGRWYAIQFPDLYAKRLIQPRGDNLIIQDRSGGLAFLPLISRAFTRRVERVSERPDFLLNPSFDLKTPYNFNLKQLSQSETHVLLSADMSKRKDLVDSDIVVVALSISTRSVTFKMTLSQLGTITDNLVRGDTRLVDKIGPDLTVRDVIVAASERSGIDPRSGEMIFLLRKDILKCSKSVVTRGDFARLVCS